MSKKRRMFDVDLPDDLETFPAGKVEPPAPATGNRRGPMATAISETAESLNERQEIEAKIRAENDALAHEHVRLKKLGLIVDLIPLDQIVATKLVRDRAPGADAELSELKASIAEIGLSNPIQIEARPDGKYELIQGMRRLTAYQELLVETGADIYGAIPAGIMRDGETVEALYRRMVDENLVRKDISFAEMAQLALNYAADPYTEETDPDKAVARLFKSASYQKRSYIRTFIRVVQRLGDDLLFAHEIPRALGLALAARMEAVEGIPNAVRAELKDWDNRSVRDELAVLRRFAGQGDAGGSADDGAETFPAGKVPSASKPRSAKTTFQIARPEGAAKCTASAGRLELRLDRDFSAIDRRRLEAAVARFLDNLD